MTAILGLFEDEKLWLIGDSYTGNADHDCKDLCLSPKVYKHLNFIIGLCGSPKHELIFEEVFKKETKKKSFVESENWIKFKLPIVFKQACIKAKVTSKDVDGEVVMGDSSFLIGYNKKFYYLDSDFSIWATQKTTVGIGVAAPYALGALTALEENTSLTAEEKLKKAMTIAAELSHYVSKPYKIVSL
jgi:ATP-dependent protease HslVU (ClpYQ) peptidase subunit